MTENQTIEGPDFQHATLDEEYSGGAGTMRHALDAFDAGVDAVLMASVFHFGEVRIGDLKRYLEENGVAVRPVTTD